MLLLPKSFHQFQLPKVLVLLLLLLLVFFGAVPAYLQGQLPWNRLAKVTTLKQLQNLRKTGLMLPGWLTSGPQPLQIGGRRWIAQQVTAPANSTSAAIADSQILMLLFPQDSSTTQPQVEWLDINGFLSASQFQNAKRAANSLGSDPGNPSAPGWKTDDFRLMKVTLDKAGSTVPSPATVTRPAANSDPPITVSFFRGRTTTQTYAVLQWYAWPRGGHPSASQWFWADQTAQLRSKRLPWIAVCVLIPIEPLGDITKVWAIAEPLSQTVQSVLMAGPLQQ